MQKKIRQAKKRNTIVPTILLILFCVGVAELLVFRFAQPELYERIMTPVREGTQAVLVWGKERAENVKVFLAEQKAQAEERALQRAEEAMQKAQEAAARQKAQEPVQAVDYESDGSILFLQQGNRELLLGGNELVVYYNQSDPQWKDLPYGRDNIGGYGCGPTAMAMVVATFLDNEVTPLDMATWAVENGHWASRSGSHLSFIDAVSSHYGLSSKTLQNTDRMGLIDALSTGHMVVALMNRGHFTQGGHFILLYGITPEGKILVADPNSRERSQVAWDADLILGELSRSRHNNAPLWAISRPTP